ncbi:MAG: maleylpyruvate isomerase family mycothiol-dependent enzyme [Actinomycetota bacterium]
MDLFDDVTAQRKRLIALLSTFTEEQWNTKSLCSAWTVHDVLAHLVMALSTPLPKFALAMVRTKGNFDAASRKLTEKVAASTHEALLARYSDLAESQFTPPGLGAIAPLTDVVGHTIDICAPLRLDPPFGDLDLRPILVFLASDKALKGFVTSPLPNVQMVATDLDWEAGRGPVVRAPARALIASMLSRRSYVHEFEGPGTEVFEAWVSQTKA